MASLVWRNRAGLALFVLALVQIVGDVAGWRPLVGLGAAWGISPRPKVFSDVDGLEPFSSTFAFVWRDENGEAKRMEITPEVYSRLAGPYNRRNVYGAALSYAPRLPEELWRPVYCYGLASDGPLRRELRLPERTDGLATEIVTRTRGRNDRWLLRPSCP